MTQLSLLEPPPRKVRAAVLRSLHVQRQPMRVEEALAADARAQRQDDQILAWFRDRPGRAFTPSRVAQDFTAWPITSVRRSLTNLTTRGDLTHWPKDRRPGPLGAKESTWSLRGPETP